MNDVADAVQMLHVMPCNQLCSCYAEFCITDITRACFRSRRQGKGRGVPSPSSTQRHARAKALLGARRALLAVTWRRRFSTASAVARCMTSAWLLLDSCQTTPFVSWVSCLRPWLTKSTPGEAYKQVTAGACLTWAHTEPVGNVLLTLIEQSCHVAVVKLLES